MVKLIIARLDDKMIIGEYHFKEKIISDCYHLTIIMIGNTFHYSIKPLIVPFCLLNPAMINDYKISEWVEVDLNAFEPLVVEYLRIKQEREESKTTKSLTNIQVH